MTDGGGGSDAPRDKRAKKDRRSEEVDEDEVLRKVTVGRKKSPPTATTKMDKKLLDIKINITNDVVIGGDKEAGLKKSSTSKPPKAPRRDTAESGEMSEGNLEAEMYLLGKKYMGKGDVGGKRSAAAVDSAGEKKEEEEDDKKVGQLVDPESDGSPNPK